MTPATRAAIFARFQAAEPMPATELEYTTPFELLAAVLLALALIVVLTAPDGKAPAHSG